MSASVSAFPLCRQREALVCVTEILKKNGEQANQAWRDMAKDLLQQLVGRGIAVHLAEAEVRSLLYAALAELKKADARRA
ncbi:DUF6074 family protein [Tianweitania sediminis]|uniref:DUF6074 family protein n=1 Tax=Tianweitania sediminis TaxID=1502156 RepID=UPI001FD7B07F|nr:DUF6074 family protein [Tianweitania sediminis]HEV7417180.1 DUF6074 family protein [Tianweitania sediminis]